MAKEHRLLKHLIKNNIVGESDVRSGWFQDILYSYGNQDIEVDPPQNVKDNSIEKRWVFFIIVYSTIGKCKTIKLTEEKTGENLCSLGLDRDFLDIIEIRKVISW